VLLIILRVGKVVGAIELPPPLIGSSITILDKDIEDLEQGRIFPQSQIIWGTESTLN